jgi:chromate reductase
MDFVSVLGISGSLRQQSFNSAALRAAKDLMPEGAHLAVYEDIGKLPLFDQDKEMDPPPIVRELKSQVEEADAIVFATPEYNYSFPGVLKNAIDWASRPYGQNSWDGKPVAIMSASIGTLGGSRAQYQLRQTFVFLNMFPLNKPEILIGMAGEKFDDEGRLTDEETRERIKLQMEALCSWALEMQAAEALPDLMKQYEQYWQRRLGGQAQELPDTMPVKNERPLRQ